MKTTKRSSDYFTGRAHEVRDDAATHWVGPAMDYDHTHQCDPREEGPAEPPAEDKHRARSR